MTKPRTALAKAPSPAPLGVRPAPGQDPASKTQTVHLDKATSRAAGGSEVGAFNLDLVGRVVACARMNIDPGDPDAPRQAAQTSEAVIAAMQAFKPVDEVEALLSAQAVMLHHLSMEAGRRAMLPKQPPDVASKLRKDAANSARAMVEMCEALDRRRGHGSQQRIVVERVVVQEGGQAVVAGSVVGRSALPSAGRTPCAIGRDDGSARGVEPPEARRGEGA